MYTTDEPARLVITEATLTSSAQGKRNKHIQRTLMGKLDGDDAGHLIARMLGGIGDKLNRPGTRPAPERPPETRSAGDARVRAIGAV